MNIEEHVNKLRDWMISNEYTKLTTREYCYRFNMFLFQFKVAGFEHPDKIDMKMILSYLSGFKNNSDMYLHRGAIRLYYKNILGLNVPELTFHKRNQNKDVIIHDLELKKQNKTDLNNSKYDYCEELSIAEKRNQKLIKSIEYERLKEINCTWVNITHQECKFLIMVKQGEDIETVKKHFIEKRDRVVKKFV